MRWSRPKVRLVAVASPRLISTKYPRRDRGVAATRLQNTTQRKYPARRPSNFKQGMNSTRPLSFASFFFSSWARKYLRTTELRRRHRNIHVAAAAPPRLSTEYPRRGLGAASLHGISTSRPRRRVSPRNIHVAAAAAPRLPSSRNEQSHEIRRRLGGRDAMFFSRTTAISAGVSWCRGVSGGSNFFSFSWRSRSVSFSNSLTSKSMGAQSGWFRGSAHADPTLGVAGPYLRAAVVAAAAPCDVFCCTARPLGLPRDPSASRAPTPRPRRRRSRPIGRRADAIDRSRDPAAAAPRPPGSAATAPLDLSALSAPLGWGPLGALPRGPLERRA